jgi:hypothetical protein
MNILNLCFSTTGNTAKVASRIEETLLASGHAVDTVHVTDKTTDVDFLRYDLVFVGSGVYQWLPGKPLMDLLSTSCRQAVAKGVVQASSPRRAGKTAVVYCTYGGAHTGANEAVPAVKYMGQLFDHLGFNVIAEWYIVGDYRAKNLAGLSVDGRLGDIRGRPNEEDLREVSERVKGILRT